MTIVCGTDFSENAARAADAAAAIAKRLGLPLHLAHATIPGGESPKARIEAEAERLREKYAATVEAAVETGVADERLVALAGRLGARLLVVGSLGERKQHRWLLGSVAERVAQSSPVPVLVVREGPPIEAWACGKGKLRVVVGVELTLAARTALQWAQELRAIGPCDFVAAQIVWPAEDRYRPAAPAPIPLDRLRPEIEQEILKDLRQWAGSPPMNGDTSFIVRPGWGRVDSHLTQLAAELNADLLVVGTHQRAGIARFWQGSVSRGVLHGAAMSVACVPPGKAGSAE
ncbi:MAG: universal stress protein [Bdellovibrionota bacterium]